jgi:proliferating cell nuclear antigen
MSTNTDTDSGKEQDPELESKPDHSKIPNSSEPDTENKSVEPATAKQVPEEAHPLKTVSDDPPRLFRASIRADVLKDLLRALRALVDEARIRLTEDSLSVRAVDPANVAMDDLELGAGAFESYEAREGTIGVNLNRLWDAVNLSDKDALVQLFLDPETRKLVVNVDELEFRIACLDPAIIRAEPDLPDLELPASVTLTRDALQRGVKAADLIADHVVFRMDVNESVFHIEAAGDIDAVDFELTADNLEEVTAAKASSTFSLDYLKRMVRTIPAGTSVTVEVGVDFPTVLSYDLADGDGSMSRMLAPRIE